MVHRLLLGETCFFISKQIILLHPEAIGYSIKTHDSPFFRCYPENLTETPCLLNLVLTFCKKLLLRCQNFFYFSRACKSLHHPLHRVNVNDLQCLCSQRQTFDFYNVFRLIAFFEDQAVSLAAGKNAFHTLPAVQFACQITQVVS